jgi:hypothetical protein
VLIEVAAARGNHAPEASYGTHFFQDLVESGIYPLPLYPDDTGTAFNWGFFERAPNVLGRLVPECIEQRDLVKVIDIPAFTGGRVAEIIMNGESDQALGYLRDPDGPGR